MGPFVVEFYETRDGQRPAEDFLDELDIKMRSKLVMTLKVLQEQSEIERAKQYRKDFLEREGESDENTGSVFE